MLHQSGVFGELGRRHRAAPGGPGAWALFSCTGLLEIWFIFCLPVRSQRLQFDVSSPNGILLFRETSKMITTYGECPAGGMGCT